MIIVPRRSVESPESAAAPVRSYFISARMIPPVVYYSFDVTIGLGHVTWCVCDVIFAVGLRRRFLVLPIPFLAALRPEHNIEMRFTSAAVPV